MGPAPTQGPIGLKSDDDGNTNPEGPMANQQAFRNLEEMVPEAEVKKESGSTPAVPTQGPQGVSLASATTKLPTSPPQPVPVQNPPPAPAQGPPGSEAIENGGVSFVYYGLDSDAKELYGQYADSDESVANQQAFRNMEDVVPGAEVKKESGSPPPVPTQGPQGVSLPSATTKLPTGPPQPVPAQNLPGAGLPPQGPPGSETIEYAYVLDTNAKAIFDSYTMSEEATGSLAKPQAFRNMEVVVPGAEVKKQSSSPPPVPTQGPWGVNQLFGGQNYLTRII